VLVLSLVGKALLKHTLCIGCCLNYGSLSAEADWLDQSPQFGGKPNLHPPSLPNCSVPLTYLGVGLSRSNQEGNRVLGTLHIIPSSTHSLHRIELLDKPPSVARLQKAVGGEITLVPGFDSILRGGEVEPCIAFYCETDFKSAPNSWANLLWMQALIRKQGFSGSDKHEILTGPVVVLWGDLEFLKSLDPLLAFLSQ